MIIDVHCHLDHHYFKKDLDDVIKRAKENKVAKIITSGIDRHTCIIAKQLAEKYDIVEAAFGRYPEDALDREGYYENNPNAIQTKPEEDIEFFKKNKESFIAIGEIGLDLFNGKDLEKQKQVFRKMISLAIKLKKPIIVHTRKAEKESIEVLEEFKDKLDSDSVILHCFTARKSQIKRAIQNNYNFSIPPIVVRSQQFQILTEMAPIRKILTETDAPYLSPYKNEDNSFNRNESSHIKESLKKIAEIKGITDIELANNIFMNYQRIFL